MNDDDVLAKIRTLATSLALARLRATWKDYRRGGLPSSSVPEAISKSSSAPLPLSDKIDRRITEDRLRISRKLSEAASALAECDRIANAWLLVAAAPEPDEVRICACGNEIHEKANECGRCRKHMSRHGLPFPLKRGDVRTERVS